MLLLLLLLILFSAGILPGLYLSVKHVLGWKSLRKNASAEVFLSNCVIFLLRTGMFLLFSAFVLHGIVLGMAAAGLFAILSIVLPIWVTRWVRKKEARTIFAGIFAGGIASGILGGITFIITRGMVSFGGMGMIMPMFVFAGGIIGGFVNGAILLLQITAIQISHVGYKIIAPLFIVRRFSTIICNACYRLTFPLKSSYELGRRYCEHCQQAVEDTKERGKVVFTFGNVSLSSDGRLFVLSNPDFETQEHHVEVSEVYIDPATADQRLLERFITYIVNYPPQSGIQSIRIFYTNDVDNLGANLKNALQNTFAS